VVVLAAGDGVRLGLGPKGLIEILGETLLTRALRSMAGNDCVIEIVVTAPTEAVPTYRELVGSVGHALPVRVVPGGPTRQSSACAGLGAMSSGPQWIAVTDVARPFSRPQVVDELHRRLCSYAAGVTPQRQPCGVVPVVPLVDSLHLVGVDPTLSGPVDRSTMVAAQTPQLFRRDCLAGAFEAARRAGVTATDEAGMVTRLGGRVLTIPGDHGNLKVTFAGDLALAAAIAAQPRPALDGRAAR
jgi:2-C-methyl-D-erythritol 4-phosphate cytidylyltransferase